jgi:hypothetical protein
MWSGGGLIRCGDPVHLLVAPRFHLRSERLRGFLGWETPDLKTVAVIVLAPDHPGMIPIAGAGVSHADIMPVAPEGRTHLLDMRVGSPTARMSWPVPDRRPRRGLGTDSGGGDGLHPNDAGMRAMAAAVDLNCPEIRTLRTARHVAAAGPCGAPASRSSGRRRNDRAADAQPLRRRRCEATTGGGASTCAQRIRGCRPPGPLRACPRHGAA